MRKTKRAHRPIAPAFLAALALTAAIGAAAAPTPKAPAGQPRDFKDLPDSGQPIEHVSPDGQFSVTFPSGCARLHSKMNLGDDGSTDVDVRLVFVTCERYQVKEEGCLVNARLGAARGLDEKAASELALAEIRDLLDGYGVSPVRQTPIRRDFGAHGVVTGLDIQAHPPSGGGDVWIRGMVRGDDIFVLVAWRSRGGMLEDPQFIAFFNSFRPWVE